MVGEAGTPGRRVGELDEEMVYESRAGEVITLGASSWRIEEIGHDRVTVSPAPGVPGKLPFWHGDAVGRPIELGRALGAFVREVEADLGRGARGRTAATRPAARADHDLDELAAENLVAYLEDEREVVGRPADRPADRRRAVPRRARRLAARAPDAVRRPRPRPVVARARGAARRAARRPRSRRSGPTTGSRSACPTATIALDGVAEALLFPDPEEVEDLVVGQVASSALFASRFRENAARALLLPRRRPGTRTPLWQQRQRAADLLAVASRYGSFPILVETYREVPVGRVRPAGAARGPRRRRRGARSRSTASRPPRASPFASSLLFDYVAAYMYDGDAPLAERRAGALTLDRDLLRELLGQEELRELLDPEALADLELSLQALTDDRQATTADQLHDLLRRLGDLSADEIAARCEGGAAAARRVARRARRVAARGRAPGSPARSAGSRSRTSPATATASASSPPAGVPDAFLGPATARARRAARPLRPDPRAVPDARIRPAAGACRSGVVEDALERLLEAGHDPARRVPAGRRGARVVDPDVLRLLRRRSLARLRREVEPVDPAALGAVPAGLARRRRRSARRRPPLRPSAALERLAEVVDQLAGVPIPASVLERDVLPARIPGYQPRLLDELGAMGEVAWVGRGSLGRDDGRIALVPARPRGRSGRPGRPTAPTRPAGPRHEAIREHLAPRGAPRSTASCSRRPAAARTARSSTRCGTSSGPARSRTTRSPRSGRCAGSGPPRDAPAPARAG